MGRQDVRGSNGVHCIFTGNLVLAYRKCHDACASSMRRVETGRKSSGYPDKNFLPGESVAVVSGYLLMAIMTVGYAAIWINGSIFYTWSFTCGIWALVPVADIVFDTGDGGSGDHNTWHFLFHSLRSSRKYVDRTDGGGACDV